MSMQQASICLSCSLTLGAGRPVFALGCCKSPLCRECVVRYHASIGREGNGVTLASLPCATCLRAPVVDVSRLPNPFRGFLKCVAPLSPSEIPIETPETHETASQSLSSERSRISSELRFPQYDTSRQTELFVDPSETQAAKVKRAREPDVPPVPPKRYQSVSTMTGFELDKVEDKEAAAMMLMLSEKQSRLATPLSSNVQLSSSLPYASASSSSSVSMVKLSSLASNSMHSSQIRDPYKNQPKRSESTLRPTSSSYISPSSASISSSSSYSSSSSSSSSSSAPSSDYLPSLSSPASQPSFVPRIASNINVKSLLLRLSAVNGRGAPSQSDKVLFSTLVQAAYMGLLKLVDYDKATLDTPGDHLNSVDRAVQDGVIVSFQTMDTCARAIEQSRRNVFENGKPVFFMFFNTPTRCKDQTGSVITGTAVLSLVMPADDASIFELPSNVKGFLGQVFEEGKIVRVSTLGGNPEFFADSAFEHEVQYNTGLDKKYTRNAKTTRLRSGTFKLVRSGTQNIKRQSMMEQRKADSM
mmetsp:Transcript_47081/g.87703  ORF Transcript_47081/g.87703 Transcript_47081/m.87703 type:complete len:529 (-) Transcript_47081:147-1733(-)